MLIIFYSNFSGRYMAKNLMDKEIMKIHLAKNVEDEVSFNFVKHFRKVYFDGYIMEFRLKNLLEQFHSN